MPFNAGVVTHRLDESRKFYVEVLGFNIVFDNGWYVLMEREGHQFSVLQANHESQQPLFRPAFEGPGMYLTIDVDKVDEEYRRIQRLKVPIAIELRDEPWGDRHFAVADPNGVGIDFVTHTPPGKEG